MIRKYNLDDADLKSKDLVAENIDTMKMLFPDAFSEGKVDFEVLRQLLGDNVDESDERYGLFWHGKRKARQIALTPSTGTLRPAKEESVDWETTKNVFIEGDNLEVLKLLQKSYAGKVKMIYIDPPYNTGKDFVYPDDFRDSIRNYQEQTSQRADGVSVKSNKESGGRFHTDWMMMMFPRLKVARSLLRADGVVFITIDDHEIASLRTMCDEVFGADNFVGTVVWQHSIQPKGYSGTFSVHHNYVVCYQCSPDFELSSLARTDEHNVNYSNPDNDPKGPWRAGDFRNPLYRRNLIYGLATPSGKSIAPPPNGWRWSKETMEAKIASGEVVFSRDETRITRKIYLNTLDGRTPETILFGKEGGTTRDAAAELKELFDGDVPFDTPKPTALIRHLLQLAGVQANDLVLDFFAGSGTTADAVWRHCAAASMNVPVILVQLPEAVDSGADGDVPEPRRDVSAASTISDITKMRLRRSGDRLRPSQIDSVVDFGFRTYRLDESNLKRWDLAPPDLEVALLSHTTAIREGRTDDDLATELVLKLGFELTAPFDLLNVEGKTVRAFGSTLYLCFDAFAPKDVDAFVDRMGVIHAERRGDEQGQSIAIFRDDRLAHDAVKTNLAAGLEHRGITSIRSI